MTIHALEDVDDAYRVTKSYLLPFDRTRWLKLALIAFFASAPGLGLNTGTNVSGNGAGGPGTDPGFAPPDIVDPGVDVWLIVAAVVAGALLIGLAFLFVGSVMEFVLVESLRSDEIAIRRYWGRYWRQGLRLFGFRLVIGLVTLAGAAIVAALVLVPVVADAGAGGVPGGGLSVATAILLAPVLLVLSLLVGIVSGFTTVFVVPVMVLENRGVLGGWRRLWGSIVAAPWQYLAYVVASVLLTVVTGILVAIAVAIGVVVLIVPFGVLGALGFVLLSVAEPVGIGVLVVAGLLFLLSVFLLSALAQVPVVVYLRYYALLVLGDVDGSLDLIPGRRAAARAADPDEGGTDRSDWDDADGTDMTDRPGGTDRPDDERDDGAE